MNHPKCRTCGKEHPLGPCDGSGVASIARRQERVEGDVTIHERAVTRPRAVAPAPTVADALQLLDALAASHRMLSERVDAIKAQLDALEGSVTTVTAKKRSRNQEKAVTPVTRDRADYMRDYRKRKKGSE